MNPTEPFVVATRELRDAFLMLADPVKGKALRDAIGHQAMGRSMCRTCARITVLSPDERCDLCVAIDAPPSYQESIAISASGALSFAAKSSPPGAAAATSYSSAPPSSSGSACLGCNAQFQSVKNKRGLCDVCDWHTGLHPCTCCARWIFKEQQQKMCLPQLGSRMCNRCWNLQSRERKDTSHCMEPPQRSTSAVAAPAPPAAAAASSSHIIDSRWTCSVCHRNYGEVIPRDKSGQRICTQNCWMKQTMDQCTNCMCCITWEDFAELNPQYSKKLLCLACDSVGPHERAIFGSGASSSAAAAAGAAGAAGVAGAVAVVSDAVVHAPAEPKPKRAKTHKTGRWIPETNGAKTCVICDGSDSLQEDDQGEWKCAACRSTCEVCYSQRDADIPVDGQGKRICVETCSDKRTAFLCRSCMCYSVSEKEAAGMGAEQVRLRICNACGFSENNNNKTKKKTRKRK